jgi:acetolactate synthase-1/2/3 large subunit
VCTIGDGAFHYNPVVASLGAAQEHRLPIMVVLFDNAGYRSQKGDVAWYNPGGEAVKQGAVVGTSIAPAPDYPLLARAYGGYGETVERPADVSAALGRGLAETLKGRLALIHVRLAPV